MMKLRNGTLLNLFGPRKTNRSLAHLKPIHKNQQEDMKFTFDPTKCDRIFVELLKSSDIKLSHALPSLEQLKRRAYCKWHNTFYHVTND